MVKKVLIFLLISGICFSQDFRNISGQIFNKTTNEKISGAQVYLNGTKQIVLSDNNGEFEIKNFPTGRYKLIVYKEGFYPVEIDFNSYLKETLIYKVLLLESAFSDYKLLFPDENLFDDFYEEFIGDTKFSDKCVIENPEVLIYKEDSQNGNILVTTKKPLTILNNGLGYKINIVLANFIIDREISLDFQRCFYYFEDLMSEDYVERIKWKKNRILTFDGSRNYFFISLAGNQLDTRLFDLRHCKFDGTFTGGNFALDYKDLKIETADSNVFYLPIEKKMCVQNSIGSKDNINFLQSSSGSVVFDQKGQLLNYEQVKIEGDWSNIKISEKLPENYILNLGL